MPKCATIYKETDTEMIVAGRAYFFQCCGKSKYFKQLADALAASKRHNAFTHSN